ncbi:histidine kinase [Microbacterium sp. B2969]|uniref:histidine kinase n=1 Tax=Microbacterium alkaliflavum TaxID=3248839 RepID=A0ABW7Q396_9MICO
MVRRWVWLATLGPIGTASLAYVFIVRGFVAPTGGDALLWPLLGVLPIFTFGVWLLTASPSLAAICVAIGGTALAVSSAYETFLATNPQAISEPWLPYLNVVGLTSDALSAAAYLVMIAAFPNGVPGGRWARIIPPLAWIVVVAGPLSLVTSEHILWPKYAEIPGDLQVPSPLFVPWLAWAGPVVEVALAGLWLAMVVGLIIFLPRAVFGDAGTRSRLRPLLVSVLAAIGGWTLWTAWPEVWLFGALALAGQIALPAVFIYGILRYGAFDVAAGDRGVAVVRSSGVLITVLYGAAVAAPAVLLGAQIAGVGLVFITALVAVALLPVRGWLQRAIRRAMLGDRERQLEMLSELGARLEQSVAPSQLLTELAQALRDGLEASWVHIRLAASDGSLLDSPMGWAGEADAAETERPAVAHDLVRGDELLGRVELGARRRGDYTDAERALLRTVAAQATSAIDNVRLTAQLAEQLEELRASRERLVAAQDDERKRLERDLHDGIQQNVVALIAGLRLARNRLQRNELQPDELVALQDHARETLTDLRELAQGIRPPVLSDNGLVAALESGVARFPIPLTVDADASVRSERFADEVETTAYYVVREALSNTAKHAQATHASVGLTREDGHLRIDVTDDGRGLGTTVTASATRGGLANIRDRVAALRGTLAVTANAPSGTHVRVELPVTTGGGHG